MANRLSLEKSPYLLQHAENPVDWYPWGDEAFLKAKQEDKPVFVSIGYATCHWCHVMEHESFEDQEVADLLNEHMVAVKVDREERPDIDQIYMTVCQALTGSGGWPLSVFMTPERKPFFVGTYFPKKGRLGIVSFLDVLHQVAETWRNDRNRILQAGNQITNAIQPKKSATASKVPGEESLDNAFRQLARSFDPTWGGFGSSPKFPTPHHLTFLLRYHNRRPSAGALALVEKTLDAMRAGGIFDHLGFGFHRYSVDEKWLVPHFEKMLYDQAMLAMAYLETFQLTRKERYARVAREIFDYVLGHMTSPEGGFYSAEDADSEGKEGLFYVWKPQEIKSLLGEEEGSVFCSFYDITETGNFEDHWSIPHTARSLETAAASLGVAPDDLSDLLERGRRKLLQVRETRVHPLKDDKVLTAWNGLMIAALAKGQKALGDSRYGRAAERAASFILNAMRDPAGGRLHRRYRLGETAHPGFADDYAHLIWGLLELYEAVLDVRFFEEALKLQEQMVELFWDHEGGGFFFTASDNEELIVRDKELYDGAVPSSNSVALLNLLRLARMTGDIRWEEKAEALMKALGEMVSDYPSAYTQFLNGVDFVAGPSREIVIAGGESAESRHAFLAAVHERFMPNHVLLVHEPGTEQATRLARLAPFVTGMAGEDGHPAAYVCQARACRRPVTDVDALVRSLQGP